MQIINLSIDVDKISKDDLIIGKKGRYLPLTIFVKDEKDKYDNDVSAALAQTKEQRENKEETKWFGNGKVVFAAEVAKKPEGKAPANKKEDDDPDLPF